jgi:tetratricopeptide (TPR) repeat protein
MWSKATDSELALLPKYCATKYHNLPDSGYWRQALGPSYEDVHHYCDSLTYINRYYKSNDAAERKFFLQNALGNIDYMFGHVKPDQPRDILLPEVHFTKGRVLILAGRDSEATREFLQAIELKPDYTAPYMALADYYSKVGKKQDALKILEEGLRQAPASHSLARRYQKLGGKKPIPVTPPPTILATPEEGETTAIKTDENVPIQPAASTPTPASEGAPVATQPAPAAEDRPKINSPTNPYCRFCP